MNYKNMTEEEITYQLEWSDENEFGTNYAKFLRKENKQLKKHHIIVRPYTNDEVREKIDNYKDNIKQLFETIIEKQQRIDKAIKYIKSHSPSDIGICGNKKKYYYALGEDSVDNLLEILGDKE